MKIEEFELWEQAYDACRERSRPLMVHVTEVVDNKGQTGTVFPSGYWRPATETATTN